LEQAVCERFPSPVAVPFHGFLEGSREPFRRLYRLRDSWEALIRLLTVLVLADCASIIPPITGLTIQENEADSARPCKRKDLLTDRLAPRIGIIASGLDRGRQLRTPLKVSSFIPQTIAPELRRLNRVRNGFSHESAKSDSQAEQIIEEAYPLLREVLLDLSELEEIQRVRVRKLIPGTPPKVEAEHLFGHAQSQRIRETEISTAAASVVVSASSVGHLDRVFAVVGERLLDLSPFYYAYDDDTGHRTKVAFFKHRKENRWTMEIVGDSTTIQEDAPPHDLLMSRFDSLVLRDETV